MLSGISQNIVLFFGVTICLVCVFSFFNPYVLIDFVKNFERYRWLIPAGVVSRVFFGIVLVLASTDTKYPTFFLVIGILSIFSGLMLPFLGKDRIFKIMDWLGSQPAFLLRLWILLGIAFGGFIIYGVL